MDSIDRQQNLSALNTLKRSQLLQSAANTAFDLIVIGGGITGAGIALDAATRGMKVLLLEKYDFAAGTSSKSTKLIHGGLRYLKQLEFGLVRTVGIERAVIHQLAPHLVTPVNMVLPIYKNGSLGKFSTSLALGIYDRLAKVKKEDRYYMINAQEMLSLEPQLNQHNLIGGAVYKEFRTDDARLTISVLKTAVAHGALCFNYAKVVAFQVEVEKICGVSVSDLNGGNSYQFKAANIINAAGPWVDEVRLLDETPTGKKLHLTKGVHLVVEKSNLPITHALYADILGDNRMVFIIPRGEIIYIGTTDTNYYDDKDNIQVTKQDMDYLLKAVNHIFPTVQLTAKSVVSAWAGLRPLIHETGKSPSELSRKDEIFISKKGLISIAGGKLTGYRKMAEKVVDIVAKRSAAPKKYAQSTTAKLPLSGADFNTDIERYIALRTGEAKQINVNGQTINYLVHTYGTGTEEIINTAFDLGNTIQNSELRILTAEIIYGIENEMVTNVSDFIIRRTGRLYFDIQQAKNIYKAVATILAERLSLDELTKKEQISFFETALVQVLPA